MMQVEEKPDVTYADVGGCKEQIEKLREVVETPLLHVSTSFLLEKCSKNKLNCYLNCSRKDS
jgi:SpoVK/Ycf46/Vps4 family AAA+-type ATPase